MFFKAILNFKLLLVLLSNINQDSNPRTVELIAVGDMMIGTNFPNSKYLPPNDGKNIFDNVKKIINDADLALGNLEGTILSGDGNVKFCKDSTKCYAFKSPDNYVYNYKEAGFDVLSIANNHINDFGEKGIENTIQSLEKVGILSAGTTSKPYTIFEKNGLKYGFTAFSPNKKTQQINNYLEASEIIKFLDLNCDIVIVSFHGGAEGVKYNRVSRDKEYFLGEDRGNPYEFSRMAIDAGADMIFGHGPHVIRAIDIYKGRIIAYSLGNFATYARFNLSGLRGLAPLLKVKLDEEGKFISGKIISAKQIGLGIPILDYKNTAAKEIWRLTKLDFPENSIIINQNGDIEISE